MSFDQEKAITEEHEEENDNEIPEGVGTASSSLEPSLDEIAQEKQCNESHSEEFLEIETDLGRNDGLYQKLEMDQQKPEKEEQVERYEVHESDYSFSDPDGEDSFSSDEESSDSPWEPYGYEMEGDEREIIVHGNNNSFPNEVTSTAGDNFLKSTVTQMSEISDRLTCLTSLPAPPVEEEDTDSLADHAGSNVHQAKQDQSSPGVENNPASVTIRSLADEMPRSSNTSIFSNKYHVGYNIAARAMRANESLRSKKRGRPRKMELPLANERTVSLRPPECDIPREWDNYTVMDGYFLDKGPPKTKSRGGGGAPLLPGLERTFKPKRSREEIEEAKKKKAERTILTIDTDTMASIIKRGRPKKGKFTKHIRREAHRLKKELNMNNCTATEASTQKQV